ncbi:hypothetical protein BS47DRAFT_385040 [Hydnum rufescens UP504]|uniref:Uncharacterized protein n=1 Tax=Hydnum rufescens UP504 TaxID=1448309 RepID=A0A9P6DQK1_9AGAM|nr:hypothetical protein BS47DRAFT_385040 [Hydnum rufescens UP504]
MARLGRHQYFRVQGILTKLERYFILLFQKWLVATSVTYTWSEKVKDPFCERSDFRDGQCHGQRGRLSILSDAQ